LKYFIKCLAVVVLVTASLSLLAAQSEDKRRDIIKYGLENEIVELVSSLQQKKDTSFNADLESLFERTRSVAVRESILSMYGTLENPAFSDFALEVLEDPWAHPNSTVNAVFSYVQKIKLTEASILVRNILDNEALEYRDRAIRTLGKIGTADDAAYLVEYLQGTIEGDERQRLIIRQNVMEALGELKSEAVWEDFVSIAGNEDENVMIRATAVRAIGSIGRQGGADILADLYETEDPMLRAAVVSGISGFTDSVAVDVILEGLKDTHYKVRLEALESLKKLQSVEAAPYVQYRAQNDPVGAVKMKSLDVLAILGEADTTRWMLEQVREEKTADQTRMKIIEALMEHSPSAIVEDAVQVAFASLKDDRKKWIRYELGKLFAKHNDPALSGVAEAYIQHRDVTTKSLGIEMFNKNRFGNLKGHVETIAADEKMGGLQSQAKRALEDENKNNEIINSE